MKRAYISRLLPKERGKRVLTLLLLLLFGASWSWFFLPVPIYGVLNVGNGAGMLLFGGAFLATLFQTRLKVRLKQAWGKKSGKLLLTAFAVCLLSGLTLSGVLVSKVVSAATNTPPAAEERVTAVLLGCQVREDGQPSLMLYRRLQATKAYLDAHPNVKVILSGGQGDDEPITEAACMKTWLTEAGVDPARLLTEDAATSTYENLRFSAAIVEAQGLPGTLVIITNEFHQFRAAMLAKNLGYDCYAVNGPSPVVLLPTYVLREVFGIVYEKLFR